MAFCISLLLCLGGITFGNCAKILLIPLSFPSPENNLQIIGQELRRNGHEVYIVASDATSQTHQGLQKVGVRVLHYHEQREILNRNQDRQKKSPNTTTYTVNYFKEWNLKSIFQKCKSMHMNETFMNRIAAERFDLALVEGVPFLSCGHLIPHVHKIPHVTVLGWHAVAVLPGTAILPSFNDFPLPLWAYHGQPISNGKMTFRERLMQMIFHILMKPWMASLYSKLGFPELTDYSTMEHYRSKGKVSKTVHNWYDFLEETQLFLLLNAGPTLYSPKPLYPNMIAVDGISAEVSKPLTKDWEALVGSAEHGVVVVSLETMHVRPSQATILKLVQTFSKRKELFLMRYSNEEAILQLPTNVRTARWLPQTDLLAHKNTKLLITHGGLNSLQEAVFHGVPVLCIPLHLDQFSNCRKVQAKGYGSILNQDDITEENILEIVDDVLTSPVYRQIIKRAGQIMRHRPMNARQTAAFWIEHVIRFGGEHLKPSCMKLTWIQYFCLDTIAFLTMTLLIVLLIIKSLLKLTIKMLLKLLQKTDHKKVD